MFCGALIAADQVKASYDHYYGPSAYIEAPGVSFQKWDSGAREICRVPPGCHVTLAHGFLVLENQMGEGTLIKLSDSPEQIQREVDEWCKPIAACTAHVDPLAQRQARTAQQAQAVRHVGTSPCASCGSWLKPNNGVTVGGKLYHAGCAPSSLAGDQKICGCGECTADYVHTSDCAVHNEPARPKGECDCAGRQHRAVGVASPDLGPRVPPPDHKPGGPGTLGSPDFGATVSDQLARQREIGGSAKADAMRVPTFAEQEAERARMAEHFRQKGVL